MSRIKAIQTNPQGSVHLALAEIDSPTPGPSQALVRVAAISLNRGEVRMAMASKDRYIPGWDLAGVVEQPAADGSSPKAGARVVGYIMRGAWSQLVAIDTGALAVLPDAVSFSQAATLPVAGLTALHAMDRAGGLLGQRVLVTGASGGVGDFAVQLGKLSGAVVVGLTNHQAYVGMVREAGAQEVVVGDPSPAAAFGPYALICDGVGGDVLSQVVNMLAPGGICVTYAALTQPEITVNMRAIVQTPAASLTGVMMLGELRTEPASRGLQRLVSLLEDGRLRPHIEVEAPWDQIAEISQRLIDRQYSGKAVLKVE